MTRIIPVLLILILIFPLMIAAQDQSLPNAQVAFMESRLMVRREPFLDALAVGYVESGAVIIVTGRSADNLWLETTAENGARGWVNADFVRVIMDLPNIPVTHSRNLIGITIDLAPEVVQNIRRIFLLGQGSGNHADVFSKVGDSITVAPHSYAPIAADDYNAGNFYYFQDTVDHFLAGEARDGNPFVNPSLAAAIGWSSFAVLSPRYTNTDYCLENEILLDCEYRLNRPAFALIMFGTNDVGFMSQSNFYGNMERIVQISLEQNIIPILTTIPPRRDFENQSAAFNDVIVRIADRYDVPLWDYGAAMRALPQNGLDVDGVHPSIPPMGLRGAADFRTYNLRYGYVIRNLTALQILDAVWTAVQASQ
ncbi:MAG: GDSL-type esterase/lipase family protein [Anaerolineae bacterium]|nr:GDSL-type esterase/lipase family protein [Anaerolineae bacterium]